MCRVFGCVASEPVSIRHELLEAENPMIRQSEEHDSGWGMAVYERPEGAEPRMVRFPHAAHVDGEFRESTELRGRIFNVHVRRATMGGLTLENTHPFCLGSNSFGHNGTVLEFGRLLEQGVAKPAGQTDSEHVFNLLMHRFDPADVVGSLRSTVRKVVDRSTFSGLNFLFSDGERLYAYRLGIFELHWLARPGPAARGLREGHRRGLAHGASGLPPGAGSRRPRGAARRAPARRRDVARADIRKFEEGTNLRGAERGAFAAERAARLTAAASE